MLLQVRHVSVQELPTEARNNGASWDAFKLLRFGGDVLSWMVAQGRERPAEHLRFEFRPGQQGQAVQCSVVEGGELPGRVRAVLAVGGSGALGG